jgi:hypothetical protein
MTITANDLEKTLTNKIKNDGVFDLKPRLDAKSGLSGDEEKAVYALRSVLAANDDIYNEIEISEIPSFISEVNKLDGDRDKLSTDINATDEGQRKEALALRALFKVEGSNIGLSTWTDSTQGSDLMFNNDFLPKTSSNPLQVLINLGQNTIKLFTSWEDNKGGPGSFALKILGPDANTYADRLARGDYQAWIDMYTNSKSGGRSTTIDPKADISRAGSTSKNIGAFAMAHLVKLPDTVDGFKSLVEKALPKQNSIFSIFAGANGSLSINFSKLSDTLSSISGVSQRLNELQVEYSDLSPKEIKNRFAAILAKSTIGVENPSKSERKFNLKLKTDVLLDELFPDETMRSNIKSALNLDNEIVLKDMELTQPSFDTQSTKASDSSTYGVLNKVFNNKETNQNRPDYTGPKQATTISFKNNVLERTTILVNG